MRAIDHDRRSRQLYFLRVPGAELGVAARLQQSCSQFSTDVAGDTRLRALRHYRSYPGPCGGGFYIFTCYFLCRIVTKQFSLRLPLFICLTFNPFIFDYLVAARGYSLALAFLLAAIAIPVWHSVGGGPSLQSPVCWRHSHWAYRSPRIFHLRLPTGLRSSGWSCTRPVAVTANRSPASWNSAFCGTSRHAPLMRIASGALESRSAMVRRKIARRDDAEPGETIAVSTGPGIQRLRLYLLMNFLGPLLLPLWAC